MPTPNLRRFAIDILMAVMDEGQSLSAAMPLRAQIKDARDAAWLQALCYGVLREYGYLEFLLKPLLPRPLREKDRDVNWLLLIGIYQLRFMQIPQHAAVNETVVTARALKKPWAVGLVNGVLRSWLREQISIEARATPLDRLAHPRWLVQRLKQDYPEHWQIILEANQTHPPLTIRVNARQGTCAQYQTDLAEQGLIAHTLPGLPQALRLEQAVDVKQLPGFATGRVSVQDASAQLAAAFLHCEPGMQVLDACAAPGGKTAHLLETIDALKLVALDHEPARVELIRSTLARLQLSAEVRCTDALHDTDLRVYDRILLDAPCSATGIIRRHPDIKWLRTPEDIVALSATQSALLEALWPKLKPGGQLLYATCSVLKAENEQVITAFLGRHPEAQLQTLTAPEGFVTAGGKIGLQLLPGVGDGFYYASLIKN